MNYQSASFREGVTRKCPTCGYESHAAPLEVDISTGGISRGGWATVVNGKQSLLIEALNRAHPRACRIEALEAALWGDRGGDLEDIRKLLAQHVHHLRKALKASGAPVGIKTHWGAGYSLEVL